MSALDKTCGTGFRGGQDRLESLSHMETDRMGGPGPVDLGERLSSPARFGWSLSVVSRSNGDPKSEDLGHPSCPCSVRGSEAFKQDKEQR